jgi:hypothetical protein
MCMCFRNFNKQLNPKIISFGLLSLLILLSGCKHSLTVRNIDSYRNLGGSPLKEKLSIGIISQNEDINCDYLVRGTAYALGKYSTDVLILSNQSSYDKVDIVANISIEPTYKGSGWNFLVNFPGFLVFAPAWNGYLYKVNYDVKIDILDSSSLAEIDTINLPIQLDIRHADFNRTWTGISWLEVGAIALVGGIFFIQYDSKVSPLLAKEVRSPIGNYIAQMIIDRLNKSDKLVQNFQYDGNITGVVSTH